MLGTTLIAIFKKEKDMTLEDDHIKLSVIQNYKLLWQILCLPCIRVLAVALFFSRVGMSFRIEPIFSFMILVPAST